MKSSITAILLSLIATAYAATPTSQPQSAHQNSGFDQAADTIGVSTQTYNPHLSSSAIKTAPNDNADDIIQNGVNLSSS